MAKAFSANSVRFLDLALGLRSFIKGVACKSQTTKSASFPGSKLPILSSKERAFNVPHL